MQTGADEPWTSAINATKEVQQQVEILQELLSDNFSDFSQQLADGMGQFRSLSSLSLAVGKQNRERSEAICSRLAAVEAKLKALQASAFFQEPKCQTSVDPFVRVHLRHCEVTSSSSDTLEEDILACGNFERGLIVLRQSEYKIESLGSLPKTDKDPQSRIRICAILSDHVRIAQGT